NLTGHRQQPSWQWWELLTRLVQPGVVTVRSHATDLAGASKQSSTMSPPRSSRSALWRIVIVGMTSNQPTKDYIARRTAEGRAKKRSSVASSAKSPETSRSTNWPRSMSSRPTRVRVSHHEDRHLAMEAGASLKSSSDSVENRGHENTAHQVRE